MRKVTIYIFLAALFFGTMEVTLKLGGNELDPFQLTFLRFMAGGLLLLPFALGEIKRNQTVITKKDYLYLLMLGVLCIPVSMLIFQFGVMKSNASTAAIIMCVNPLFTMLFAHFLLGETMTKRNGIAMAAGVAGILFMVNPFQMQKGNTPEGILLVLIGAIFFSLYSVMGKKRVQKIGTITQTSISFLMGSAVLLAVLLAAGKPVIQGIWPGNLLLVLYLSIVVTGLGYLFYFLAIAKSDATTGSITFLVKSAIAPLAAVMVLGEEIGFYGCIGIALVLIGSFINIGAKKRAA